MIHIIIYFSFPSQLWFLFLIQQQKKPNVEKQKKRKYRQEPHVDTTEPEEQAGQARVTRRRKKIPTAEIVRKEYF